MANGDGAETEIESPESRRPAPQWDEGEIANLARAELRPCRRYAREEQPHRMKSGPPRVRDPDLTGKGLLPYEASRIACFGHDPRDEISSRPSLD